MDVRLGTVACPKCEHLFRVRWQEPSKSTWAPKSRPMLEHPHPYHLGIPRNAPITERILTYLWKRNEGGEVSARRLYRALHCTASECHIALRSLEATRHIKTLSFAHKQSLTVLVWLQSETPWVTWEAGSERPAAESRA